MAISRTLSRNLRLPSRISGRALVALERFTRTRPGARLVWEVFRAELGVSQLGGLPERLFGQVPIDNRPLMGRAPRAWADERLPLPGAPWSGTSESLTSEYASGRATPSDVARRALEAARRLAERRPSVGPLLTYLDEQALRDADASTERWRKGAPLGPLDGVPTAIKEETGVKGLPRLGGSDLLDDAPAAEDSTCVARLRAAGAIILGDTPMTEFGMSPLGFNPKRSMPRNPHAVDRSAGGSSTGAGVAVATGLVPFATGVDGGGSVRTPASFCGVFGIKPSWGRVSRAGGLSVGTVSHIGPLASSTADLARALEVMSGPDGLDPQADLAPPRVPGSFVNALARGVRGMRVAVVESEWADAAPAVARAGREALRALEKEGAVLVDVRLELARWAAPIGYLTIGTEARATHRALLRSGAEFTRDLRITYALLGDASAEEYVVAQRLRSGLRKEMARAFGEVDLFALPVNATTAPRMSDGDYETGFVDARALDAACRHVFLANLAGLPALSAPVGLDEARAPIGLQLLGDAWDEATVLAASAHLERIGVARVERPSVTAYV
jgi:aspartyl-tRNA(Asn)/glutamyl-tRNA(Gln) amidotransferase subunit A